MKEMEYDVLVVGGGPAGSVSARYAAEKGASVLMIEKRQEIGSPVRCGEGIAKRWLDEIGLQPSRRWIAHEVDGARIISPDGSFVSVDEAKAGDESGYIINRDAFDKELAMKAAKSGVDVMVKTYATALLKDGGKVAGARIRSMGEDIDVRAKIVIGADGFESQVGRWAGINTALNPKDIDSCYQYTLEGIEGDPRFNDFYVGSMAPGGYIWVFWKGDGIANVGIGVQMSKIDRPGAAKWYLDRFIESHPELGRGKSIRDVSGAVSISAPMERTVADGVMLVGDAARMIDPVSGGGIYNASIAAKYAGEVAAEAVEMGDTGEDFLKKYEKLWRARMEERLYRNWLVKEKMVSLSDDVFNKVIGSLADVGMDELNVSNILKIVESRHPELLEEFRDFI